MVGSRIDNLWLIIYVVIWCSAIFRLLKREKRFTVSTLIMLSYLGYAIMSMIYFNLSYPKYSGLRLFPFLFQYFMIIIALRPVTQYCGCRVDTIERPNERAVMTFLVIFLICSIIGLLRVLPNISSGLFAILTDASAGASIYNDTMGNAYEIGDGTSLRNLPIVFTGAFSNVGILLTFYYFTKPKNNVLFSLLLIISNLSPLFYNIAISQRGPAIDCLYSIAVSYFLFRPFFSSKIKKIARIGGVVIVLFLVVTLTAITLSRFGRQSSTSAGESVFLYVGEENLNFNLYAFDNNGLRYGDRTAPIFKRLLGFNNVPHNFVERRAKYPYLKIDDYSFIGFVGDFLLDYGPFFSLISFIIFSFLFCKKTRIRGETIELHQLLLVQFAACVCMCGGMKLFSFADNGNLQIIAVFLTYLYLKVSAEQSRKAIN